MEALTLSARQKQHGRAQQSDTDSAHPPSSTAKLEKRAPTLPSVACSLCAVSGMHEWLLHLICAYAHVTPRRRRRGVCECVCSAEPSPSALLRTMSCPCQCDGRRSLQSEVLTFFEVRFEFSTLRPRTGRDPCKGFAGLRHAWPRPPAAPGPPPQAAMMMARSVQTFNAGAYRGGRQRTKRRRKRM